MSDVWRMLTPLESRRGGDNLERYASSLVEWKKLWHYLAYRDIWLDPADPVFSNSGNEMALCIRKDLERDYLAREWLMLMPMRREIPTYP